jgi:hypothetical protein
LLRAHYLEYSNDFVVAELLYFSIFNKLIKNYLTLEKGDISFLRSLGVRLYCELMPKGGKEA